MAGVAQIAIGEQVDQHQGVSSGTVLAHHGVELEGRGLHRGNFILFEGFTFLESKPDNFTIFLDRQEALICEDLEAAILYELTQVIRSSGLSTKTLEHEELPQICNQLLAQEDIERQRIAGVVAIF